MGLYFKFSIFMSLHPTIQQQLISANTDSHLWSFQSSPFLHPLLNFSHLPVFPFWHKCNQLAVPKAKGGFCILSRTYIFLKEEIITHTQKKTHIRKFSADNANLLCSLYLVQSQSPTALPLHQVHDSELSHSAREHGVKMSLPTATLHLPSLVVSPS